MRSFLTMTWREFHARRVALVAAAFAGVIPFLIPYFPGVKTASPAELRGVMAAILSLSFGAATAVLLGSTVIVRDLMEQRLSFYFARPLSVFTIWGGKLLAAALIVLGVLALCAVPTVVANGGFQGIDHPSLLGDGIRAGLAILMIILIVLLLAHAVSSAIRSQSRWLAVDVVMTVISGFTLWWSVRSLFLSGFWGFDGGYFHSPNPAWAIGELVALGLALLVSTYVQVSVGRTDPVRAHGAFSKTFWSIAGSSMVLLVALVLWLNAATPTSLLEIESGTHSPKGDWVFVQGSLRHRGLAKGEFIVNPATGQYVKLPLTSSEVQFSEDGTRVSWLEPLSLESSTHELLTVDLSSQSLQPVRSTLTFPWGARWRLSPSGRRLGAIERGVLTVYDVASGKSLAGAKLPEPEKSGSVSLQFHGEDRIQLFKRDTYAQSAVWPYLLEFDVPTRLLVTTGRIEPVSTPHVLSVRSNRSGDRLLVVDGNQRSLRDGRTGASLASLGEGNYGFKPMDFLSDGGIVTLSRDADAVNIDSYSPAGTWQKRIVLGSAAKPGFLVGQSQDGRVLAYFFNSRTPETQRVDGSIVAVDIASGTIKSLGAGLRPLSWWSASAQAKFFIDVDGALVTIDSKGGKKVLLGGTH